MQWLGILPDDRQHDNNEQHNRKLFRLQAPAANPVIPLITIAERFKSHHSLHWTGAKTASAFEHADRVPWRLHVGRKQTISPLHRRSLQICPDKIGTSFTDHHRRGIGVARNQPWHDAGVGDVQPLQPAIFKVRIDDGISVGPHPAGADRVIYDVGATLQATEGSG